MKLSLMSAMLLFCLFSLAAYGAGEPALKIGFVDMDRVFAAYDRAAGVTENIREIKEEGKEERDNLEAEINRLNKELQEGMQVLPGQEIDRRRQLIQQKLRELLEFDRALKARESEPVHQALSSIYEAVEKFGRDAGYDMILEKRKASLFGRTVLYGKPELDVTEKIIGLLAK